MSAVMQKPEDQNLSVVLTMDDSTRDLLRQADGAMVIASEYVIDCSEMAQAASNERTSLAMRIDAIKARRKKFIEPAQQIIANAEELFNPAITALTAARDMLGGGLLEWDRKEKARIAKEREEREAAERKARQEAEAEAAAARARAKEKADEELRKAREAEEARQKALREGNARAAAAAAAAAATANERANAAIEEGDAKAMQAQVAVVAAVAPVVEPVKIAGTSIRENWEPVLNPGVTEEDALDLIIQAAATDQQLRGLLKLDQPALKKLAKALKTAMRVPGYTAKDVPTLAGSRK